MLCHKNREYNIRKRSKINTFMLAAGCRQAGLQLPRPQSLRSSNSSCISCISLFSFLKLKKIYIHIVVSTFALFSSIKNIPSISLVSTYFSACSFLRFSKNWAILSFRLSCSAPVQAKVWSVSITDEPVRRCREWLWPSK